MGWGVGGRARRGKVGKEVLSRIDSPAEERSRRRRRRARVDDGEVRGGVTGRGLITRRVAVCRWKLLERSGATHGRVTA